MLHTPRRLARGVLILSVLATSALRADGDAASPSLEIEAGALLLASLPAILDEPEIARQLTTGLTATLAFRIEVVGRRDSSVVGGARVEVRYELWDEVFHVVTLDAAGVAQRETISSKRELEQWWATQRFVVLDPVPTDTAGDTVRVILDAVPFSHSEQLDTQRWFEEAVRRGESGHSESAQSAEGGKEALGRIFSVLLATSIRRQALTSYRWTVPWPERGSP